MRTRWRAARRVHLVEEPHLARPAVGLGEVHRGVGFAEQRLDARHVVVDARDADAHRDVELLAGEVERLVERAADALGDRRRRSRGRRRPRTGRRTRRRRSATACRSCAAPLAAGRATCFNSSSPVWCPNVSFTSLNRLRSRNITTGGSPPRRRISSIAWLSRSTRSWRFGQPRQRVVQRLVREQRLDLFLGLAGRARHADRDREHERAEEADRLGVRRST